jgi:hypothetical protein
MPGMTPAVSISPAPVLNEQELRDKKKRAAVTALIDLGACCTSFKLQPLTDPSEWSPMALVQGLMLLIEHGGAPDINRARAKQAANDYLMVCRRAPEKVQTIP